MPSRSTASDPALRSSAATALPPSPAEPTLPLPATVSIAPGFTVTPWAVSGREPRLTSRTRASAKCQDLQAAPVAEGQGRRLQEPGPGGRRPVADVRTVPGRGAVR